MGSWRLYLYFWLGLCVCVTGSCSVIHTGLKPVILLPQPPKHWNYRNILPSPACFVVWWSPVCQYFLLWSMLCLIPDQEDFLMFSSERFIVSTLSLWFILNNSCIWCEVKVSSSCFFFFLVRDFQWFQHHLMKRLSFPLLNYLGILLKIIWPSICLFFATA
jgi:hypothetical protein